MTNRIDRKDAEACRREALRIERLDVRSDEQETLRRALTTIWNEFCVQETARLAAQKAPTFAQVLPGVWVHSR